MNKKKSRKRFTFLIIILSAGLLMTVCFFEGNKQRQTVSAEKEEETVYTKVSVQALQEKKENNMSGITLAGAVMANNSSKIKVDPTKGTVENLAVNEGDWVIKGQKLFTYKNTEMELALKEFEAALIEKKQLVASAESTAAIKWALYNEASKTYTSEQASELAELKGQASIATNEIANAKAAVETAQVTYQAAQEKLEKNSIKASTDGQVKTVNKDLLEKSDDEKNTETFIEIIDTSSIYVKGKISEFDRENVTLEQCVEIIDRKNPKKTWQGKITRIGYLVAENGKADDKKEEENPNLSKYPYTVKLDATTDAPLMGSNVYIKLLSKENDLIKIPKNYVLEEQKTEDGQEKKNYFIWKVVDEKLQKQPITIDDEKSTKDMVVIVDGINKQEYIVAPKEEMKEGMEVK